MKRIVLWLLSTVSAVVLLFGYHTSTSGPAATTQEPVGASLATTTTTTAGGSGSGGSGGGGSTVTGKVAQTRWGPVQVQLTTDASGTITSVEVVQYPSGNREDEQINSYALPRLVQATLDAQSADIDMVSGATVTSEGYLQSLQSALDQVPA
jgi:uncharacterized protein with FMN-binding domain